MFKIKNLDAVIEELQTHFVSYLEEHGIDTRRNFKCLNPKHEDSNPSCALIKPGNIRAFCFSCSERFDIVDACRILENKPGYGTKFFTDVIQYLAEKYKIQIEFGDMTEESIYELTTYRAYRDAAEYITNSILSPAAVTEASRRKWSNSTLKDMLTGTVESNQVFVEHLHSKGYDDEFLKDCDLLRSDIFNENCLIFTICDEHGHPVGFAARNLLFDKNEPTTGSKYINQRTTGVKCNIYQKGRRLYGFNLSKDIPGQIYIFEGQGDVTTAREHGLLNCAAIGSTALTTEHVMLLKENNKYDIILCFDNDKAGQTKIEKLLDTRFAGHKDMRVSIVLIPDGMDPDDYIRNNGIEAFRSLAKWSAFEWRLDRFDDSSDNAEISRAMIPFIINEPSYIAQEDMCKILSARTGYSMKNIQLEVSRLQNLQEERKATERKVILENALHDAINNPADAEIMLTEAKNKLFQLSKKYDEDYMSEEAFLREVRNQKNTEEASSDKFSGFILGDDLRYFQDAMAGEWDKDVVLFVGGRANSGKTALVNKLAFEIAAHKDENNATVVYHTIDDTAQQTLPRLVSIGEGSKTLTMNQIKSPNFWAKEDPTIHTKRHTGYSVLESLIKDGRLVVKDANHGESLAYAETLIQYYQERYPGRKFVYILDNFHKLKDYTDSGDERIRFKKLSNALKGLATTYHITIIATVEYTKIPAGTRPANNNIAESVSLEYDSNLILHMFNEMHELGPNATMCHMVKDKDGNLQRFPRIEMIFGKNKITSFKNSLWFDFYPACSDFIGVDESVVATQIKQKELEKTEDMKKQNKVGKSTSLYDA